MTTYICYRSFSSVFHLFISLNFRRGLGFIIQKAIQFTGEIFPYNYMGKSP
jgi:hypothetical protein